VPLRRLLRLAPWAVRARILESVRIRVLPRVAPERRLGVARRVVPLSAPPQLPAMRAAPAAPTMRVRTGQGWLSARRDPAASPTGVRRQNLDRVVAALDAAGIDWFRIPARSPRLTAVAVRAADRDRATAVLTSLTAAGEGRLTVARHAPGRRGTPEVVRVCWPVTDPRGCLVLGEDYSCEVEFWRARDGMLAGPRGNPVADVIPADEPVVVAADPVFSAFSSPADPAAYRTRQVFTLGDPERISFPVDAVYTWVDGNDPAWQARKARALGDNSWLAEVNRQAANSSRFASRDELRYSLRSLHCFAPWIRRVFIVTDDQVPAWLDVDHERVTLVSHREVFGDTGRLPTFNSQAIESRLHRIDGLSEHFLYLNDDVFFGRPVTPDLFFTPGGLTRFFPSGAVVDSAPRSPADPPVNSAGKNNRELIKEAFGRVLTRKMMHTPHPSRRSVIAEIEDRFAEHVEATAAHQFRHPDDISLLSSLQQYYAYLTGRAAPGVIRYMYTDLANPETPFRLAELLRNRHLDVFCLNDTDSDPATAAEQAALLADFLPAYLPFVSPFELDQPRGATLPIAAVCPAPVVARQLSRDGRAAPEVALPAQADRGGETDRPTSTSSPVA
jgi:Stealth protein CR2, conserved region 2/Stealth protein CR3, conserved region 3/Stealth protein CR4, conserved region 4/Stealth protein CR1, conserved region 1